MLVLKTHVKYEGISRSSRTGSGRKFSYSITPDLTCDVIFGYTDCLPAVGPTVPGTPTNIRLSGTSVLLAERVWVFACSQEPLSHVSTFLHSDVCSMLGCRGSKKIMQLSIVTVIR